ncbi:hypothetical protein Aduo_002224 [Ancylostoma duodenale]
MLVSYEAHVDLHCATAYTMSNVRQQFWIPSLREQVKKFYTEMLIVSEVQQPPFPISRHEGLARTSSGARTTVSTRRT